MRNVVPVFLLVLAVAWGTPQAGMFPAEMTYHIYIYDTYAGKDVIKVTEKEDVILFESKSRIEFETYVQDLTCETVVDKKTFAVKSFKFDGLKVDIKIAGDLTVKGDSVYGDLYENDAHFPSGKRLVGFVAFFQNYIVEHQVALCNAVASSKDRYLPFHLLLPSDFAVNSGVAVLASELEVPTLPKPTVCEKYGFSVKNGPPFFGYFDPERRIPVYMDFPGANTEVFLDAAFGESPKTKYVQGQENQESQTGHEGHDH